MTKKHPPQGSPTLPADADASGSFEALANLDELAPLAPLLKKSIEHMKKGNAHQLQITVELDALNVNQAKSQRAVWVTNALILLILACFVLGVLEIRHVRIELEHTKDTLADVTTKLASVETNTETTKLALEDQPKIRIEADTASALPVLVVEPPKKREKAASDIEPEKASAKGVGGSTFEVPLIPSTKERKDTP